jgi:UDP-N-acetylmuramyl pentapeptide phosphotransferase/UDP-N-acetylglucosamine-1-phosphate transferase
VSSYLIVFTATALAAIGLVITQHWHGRFSHDNSFGVQNHHTEPTPRVGGIAILLGLVCAWLLASKDVRTLLGPMLLAGVPAFVFGLLEDVTKKVSVLSRLLATMASGVLAWYLTGIAMQHTGINAFDWALGFLPLAVLFTAFAVGGLANAINIIDGFNGLAVGSVAIMLGAIGLIAWGLGDHTLALVCMLVACCALGFAVVNWPFGHIFLGDGGAYLLGFLLAWLAVLLPMRHLEVNAFATLLVCAYPVLEVMFSVRRRRKRQGHHPGQADKAHLHHFVHRRIICKLFPHMSTRLKNGLTSPICWLLTALPCAWAVVFAQNTAMLATGFALATLTYAAVYARLTQFRWCFSPVTLRATPEVSSI